MGEKLSDLEQFYPDRMASRILGMGDVLTLIEKAGAELDEEKAQQKAEEEAFMAEEMKKLQKRYQKEKEEIHARFVAERKVGYGVWNAKYI